MAPRAPPSPRPQDFAEALISPATVRYWAIGLTFSYAAGAIALPPLSHPRSPEPVVLVCLVACAAFLLVWIGLPMKARSEDELHRIQAWMFAIASLVATFDVATAASPVQVGHPILVMTTAATVLYRTAQVLPVLVLPGLGVAAGTLAAPEATGWSQAMSFYVCALLAGLVVHRDRIHTGTRLRGAWSQLRDQAVIDPLTGLANRRGLVLLGEQAQARARRDRAPMALMFIDVDGLKAINDRFGHGVGDQVIRAAGNAIRRVCRDGDVVARLGGDEFAVLLHGVGEADVPRVIARVRDVVQGTLSHPQGAVPWTVSVGLAPVLTGDAGGLESALAAADTRMYADKRQRKAQPPA